MSQAPCRECQRLGLDRTVFPECRRIQGQFGGCCGNCKWPDHGARCRWGGHGGDGRGNNKRTPRGGRGGRGPKKPRTPKNPKALPPGDGSGASAANAIVVR